MPDAPKGQTIEPPLLATTKDVGIEREIDRDNEDFNKGVLHTVDLLAKALDVTDWHHADGSESYDDDLQQTLMNILIAKGLYCDETGRFARVNSHDDLVAQLSCAIGHIEHMAAWIGEQQAGYSFESLGEDTPGIRAALSRAKAQGGQ